MSLGCVVLIVGSGLLQFAGLFLVARDLWRVQNQTFGTPVWMRRVRARTLRLLGRNSTTTVQLQAALESAIALRGHATVRKSPGETVEERVAALEANFGYLEGETRERFAALKDDLNEHAGHVKQLRQDLDQLEHEREQARRGELRETLPWQWIGTALFALGTALTIWADLAC